MALKLLYANDERGRHAPSWYADGIETLEYPTLHGTVEADVCIVGAGYSGLGAALELARAGCSVVVLDAHRVGWGASGRNGGQLGSGFNKDQQTLHQLLGETRATALWQLSEDAKAYIHATAREYDFPVDYVPGIVHAAHRKRYVKAIHAHVDFMHKHYDYQGLEALDREALCTRVASDSYHGGLVDHGAGHLHALKLATLFAKAAEINGARLFERSEVLRVDAPTTKRARRRVITASGVVLADQVLLAANGYLDRLEPRLHRWLMPINNFIVTTEPLGDLSRKLLPRNDAVADTRFVVNYFRRLPDSRLLFGGGENYSYRFPCDIASVVRPALTGVFPELRNARIDAAWGGTLAITRQRLPMVRELEPGLVAVGGYSGHGVALALMTGKAVGEYWLGSAERFALLEDLPGARFPGNEHLRAPLLALAMTGYAWLDRL